MQEKMAITTVPQTLAIFPSVGLIGSYLGFTAAKYKTQIV